MLGEWRGMFSLAHSFHVTLNMSGVKASVDFTCNDAGLCDLIIFVCCFPQCALILHRVLIIHSPVPLVYPFASATEELMHPSRFTRPDS